MKIHAWTIPHETWQKTWPAWPPDAVVMAERFDAVTLAEREDCQHADWEQGHLFDENQHVAWMQMGDWVRAVLASHEIPPFLGAWGEPDDKLDLSDYETETQEIVLWGVKSDEGDPFWIELYIPHIMEPPHLHPKSHAQPPARQAGRRFLVVETYTDPKTGSVAYHRYKELRFTTSDREGLKLGGLNERFKLPPLTANSG